MIASGFQLRELFAISLFIISHSLSFVKGFCKTFFKFFEEVLVSNFFAEALQPFTDLRFFATASLSAACILYHIGLRLSRGFRKLFEVFSKPFGFDRPCQTTCLLYHTVHLLSTPFDKVSRKSIFKNLAQYRRI